MKIFVGSSSHENINPKYIADCRELLEEVLKDNDLVFGANILGIMGESYKIAKKNNNQIISILPKYYQEELTKLDSDQEIITDTMISSTLEIYKTSDIILFLPGGIGTLYELFTSLQSKICHEIKNPIIIYNSCGYYDDLLTMLKKMVKENFAYQNDYELLKVFNTKEEILNYLKELNINEYV